MHLHGPLLPRNFSLGRSLPALMLLSTLLCHEARALDPESRVEALRGGLAKEAVTIDQLVPRAMHHQIATNSAGNRYVEIANGLNYLDDDGGWQPTECRFVAAENGFSVMTGPAKVFLKSNLNQPDAVRYVTPEGYSIESAPLYLGYFDPVTGKQVVLAQLQDTVGELAATNVVVYSDAFDELHASVRYTYLSGAFHQDILLHESPPPPGEFGLSDRSRLEVITEFAPPANEPLIETHVLRTEQDPDVRAKMVEPDLADDLLKFGEHMSMPPGQAFAEEESQDEPHEIPVSKRWQPGPRPLLIEGIEYRDLTSLLRTLPQYKKGSADIRKSPVNGVAGDFARPHLERRLGGNPRLITASTRHRSQRSVVLDYVDVINAPPTTFQNGITYLVRSPSYGTGNPITFHRVI